MAWYVFALIDTPPDGRAGRGLTGPLAIRPIAGAFAAVERRADVPPADFGSLDRHQRVVAALAARVPAILPVRFGTLLEEETLEEALGERDDEIAEAFGVVRGRVQFTWRRSGPRVNQAEGGARRPEPASGAEYLRRAAAASRPAPPAIWRTVRSKTVRFVAGERYQPRTAALPDALYHLVARGDSRRYSSIAAALVHANPALTITGPWPPFAFAPEVL
jgi:hypothetical protein